MGNVGSEPATACDKIINEQVGGAPVLVYSTTVCPWCVRAKRLLDEQAVSYVSVELNRLADGRCDQRQMAAALHRRTGERTVPQVFICGQHVGGFDELYRLQQSGALKRRVAECDLPNRRPAS